MNQILETFNAKNKKTFDNKFIYKNIDTYYNFNNNNSISKVSNNKMKDYKTKNFKNKYKFIFIFSILIIIFLIVYYIFLKYDKYKKENISKNLMRTYNVTTLYNSYNDYTSKFLYDVNSKKDPFIIGLIKIDKINLMYPILSETNTELLKISPCRFFGPLPNNIGNLCIVGHNYVDNKLFSKIHLLEIGDLITLYDINGNESNYIVYNKKEVSPYDTSCLSQDTNGLCLLTLITCNNVKGTRVVIYAKQVA